MGQCLRELAAGLPQLTAEPARWHNAASTSISKARERVGPGVMRLIFEHLAGPLGGQAELWRGRRVCAVDGTTVKVADTEENAACFGGPKSSPFPLLRLLVLGRMRDQEHHRRGGLRVCERGTHGSASAAGLPAAGHV